MPAFFFKFTIMSWSIPAQVEKDIIAGKATYRTFQTGSGGQSILPVPTNSYAVIFGYDFSPAGGGIKFRNVSSLTVAPELETTFLRWFQTQQISFYTGTDFYPFIHHIDSKNVEIVNAFTPATGVTTSRFISDMIDSSAISRQVYITSSNDVIITHGLILNSPASQNAIPVTNRTPQGLTYGGSGQNTNTQTNFGPAGTPLQFMQPSVKDYADFAFGLLPNNADDQAFATPDATNGLLSASTLLNTLGATFRDAAACNYFLNLHYALYQSTTPETRG
jgi:hypothetical protein